ncbi:hypothetical protein DF186_23050, partial [Enterococcus hirae]
KDFHLIGNADFAGHGHFAVGIEADAGGALQPGRDLNGGGARAIDVEGAIRHRLATGQAVLADGAVGGTDGDPAGEHTALV